MKNYRKITAVKKITSTREKSSKITHVKNKPLACLPHSGPLDGYFQGDYVFHFFKYVVLVGFLAFHDVGLQLVF